MRVSLGGGPGHDAHYLACDLSHEYVSINGRLSLMTAPLTTTGTARR
jgi:hypothetical protein